MNQPSHIKNETSIVSKAFNLPYSDKIIIGRLIKLAQRHSRLMEISLIKKLSLLQTEELETIEGDIRAIVSNYGLRVSFERRTNGYTVRLHDKNNSTTNTLGGSNNGYGIGKPKQL